MKIAAYVQQSYAKQAYSNENFNRRAWIGLEVIIDALRCSGYAVDYAGAATIHQYDVVLVSLTSDCDWWSFIAERLTWQPGPYKIIVGGAGLLNVRPFLDYFDVGVLGRGENLIVPIIESLPGEFTHASVIYPQSFNLDGQYHIMQATRPYPNVVRLQQRGKTFKEFDIGCPYKCYFCGYTWQRQYVGAGTYQAGHGIFSNDNREQAMLDIIGNPPSTWQEQGSLRIIGLDGISERLRLMVNKKITRPILRDFFAGLATIPVPHQIKMYNIVGYPTETESDFMEFIEDLQTIDKTLSPGKQWSIVLHCTPFRAMPATPAACWSMSYRNYRGQIVKWLSGGKYKGNIFYKGNRFWAVEGMGTDALPSVTLSAICHRGTETDASAVRKIACAPAFWKADTRTRQATLEKYFDVEKLFGTFTWDNLPTRYLRTYAEVERIKA